MVNGNLMRVDKDLAKIIWMVQAKALLEGKKVSQVKITREIAKMFKESNNAGLLIEKFISFR